MSESNQLGKKMRESKPKSIVFGGEGRAECLVCNSTIPAECVIPGRIDPRQSGPTRRDVRVYCENCRRGCKYMQILRNGDWQIDGVEVIGDRDLISLRARIDHVRGVVQTKGA